MWDVILVILALLLFVCVILPLTSIVLAVTIITSAGYALVVSIWCFTRSLSLHKNPYTTFVDASAVAQPGTRRNYFFGPGYHQIKSVVNSALTFQRDHLSTVEEWKDRHTGKNPWYIDIWVWIFYGAVYACTFIFGYAWLGVFAIALSIPLVIGMSIFFLYFVSLWVADRLYLLLLSISSRCDNCKHRVEIPVFACPTCGVKHHRLTPGAYGVLRRKCACGETLPTTIFLGRSKLDAYCPRCDSRLAASDARQFGIQLVGSTNAGKTTFLASFWHQYLKVAAQVTSLETVRTPTHAFDDLETWFKSGVSGATAETNANMYSVIHRLPEKPPLQFSLYDIAGEAFLRLDDGIQQQQFRYCEGILFIIDPTDPGEVNGDAVVGFLNTFRSLTGKSSMSLSYTPAAIVITKADLFKREIGLVKIKAEHKKNADKYADADGYMSYHLTRNGVCRAFLHDHGFSNIVNLMDSEFLTTAVFPVSAMGHEAEQGVPYEPWGVMPPVFWILSQAGEPYSAYFAAVSVVVENSPEERLA